MLFYYSMCIRKGHYISTNEVQKEEIYYFVLILIFEMEGNILKVIIVGLLAEI